MRLPILTALASAAMLAACQPSVDFDPDDPAIVAATVLQGLSSSIDRDIRVDFQELSYNKDEVRLSGNADSFESVDHIAEKLKKNYLFNHVEIVGAKLAADNSQVDFELQLKFNKGGGS